jgi:uncharacterized protein (TIGR03083 family)
MRQWQAVPMDGELAIGEVYGRGRRRISDLVVGRDGSAPVPTCPGWSVADVIAHLTGVCADILAGNMAGVASVPWTGAQVTARRDRSLDDLLAEWSVVGPQVESVAEHFPAPSGAQWVADQVTHEHDIRTALDLPDARDSAGVEIAIAFLVTGGLHSSVSARGLPPLEVRAGQRSWQVGVVERPTEVVGVVEAPSFEVFRALTGRRSAAQIRGMGWTVDPEPYVPAFQFGPFLTTPTDIEEGPIAG